MLRLAQIGPAPLGRWVRRSAVALAIALICGFLGKVEWLVAATPTWQGRPGPFQATTSSGARQSAVRSIPFDKLDEQARAKVNAVLSQTSIFRRMPVQVTDCDPELYLFLVRHPDVVTNIWEVLQLSNLQVRQVGPDRYRVAEASGTVAEIEFLYRSHDTHVAYAEGIYRGPLLGRPVKGRALLVLRSGYVLETDGRYYITSRLDSFVRVDDGPAELFTKTIQPLVGKTADLNFIQTVAFLGSLSRTAEVNTRGVQRLATKLENVQPQYRQQLAELAAQIAQKPTQASTRAIGSIQVVSSTEPTPKR